MRAFASDNGVLLGQGAQRDDVIDEHPRRLHRIGGQIAQRHDGLGLGDDAIGGHGHHRVKVPRRGDIGQVAKGIGPVGMDQGHIRAQGGFHQMRGPVDLDHLLARGQFCAYADVAENRANPGAARADAFGQDALGVEFHLDLASVHQADRMGVQPQMRGDQPRDLPRGQQVVDAHARLVRVVLDHGQPRCAMFHQRADQRHGGARHAKTADHHRVAILDPCDGGLHGAGLVRQLHAALPVGRPTSAAKASSASRRIVIISAICSAVMINGGASKK